MYIIPYQANMISFLLVDATGTEVPGLGGVFNVNISKNGGAAAAGVGAKAEISGLVGWYTYMLTAAECDTPGILSVQVQGVGTIYQNLEYEVRDRRTNAVEFTYNIIDNDTGFPLPGVSCWFNTDAAMQNTVWYGITDVFGDARDINGMKPWLDPGTYYIMRAKNLYTFNDPDIEVVS